MGLGGSPIWHLLILLVVVIGVFGSKRLAVAGEDLHRHQGFSSRLAWRWQYPE